MNKTKRFEGVLLAAVIASLMIGGYLFGSLLRFIAIKIMEIL